MQTIEKDYYDKDVDYKFEDFGMAFSIVNLETEIPIPDYERYVNIVIEETVNSGDHR